MAIYEYNWNKLTANKNNRSFKQYVSAQFNRTSVKNIILNSVFKGKQANNSRISSFIPPKPSKSVLAKSKFFKKNKISDSVI